jgi:hypothetical protein
MLHDSKQTDSPANATISVSSLAFKQMWSYKLKIYSSTSQMSKQMTMVGGRKARISLSMTTSTVPHNGFLHWVSLHLAPLRTTQAHIQIPSSALSSTKPTSKTQTPLQSYFFSRGCLRCGLQGNQDVVYFSAGTGGKGGPERMKKVDYEVFDAIERMREPKSRLELVIGVWSEGSGKDA